MRLYKSLLQTLLANRVKAFRSSRHMPQEAMAEILHITPRSYFDLEHDKYSCSALTLVFFLLVLSEGEVAQLLNDCRQLLGVEKHNDVA